MIKTIAKPIMFLRKKMDKLITYYLNRERYLKGTISEIEYKMKKVLLDKSIHDHTLFYQSYPPLKISGIRGSYGRYNSYNMKKYLNKEMSVLDIGSNLNFFSAFISPKVKSVDAIETVDYLVEIGEILIEDEKIKNVNIMLKDFKNLNKKKKYDLIISCAVHDLVGDNKNRVMLSFNNYLNRMGAHLNKNGLILLESHGIYYNYGDNDLEERIKLNKDFVIIEKGVSDDYEGTVREFFWLKRAL